MDIGGNLVVIQRDVYLRSLYRGNLSRGRCFEGQIRILVKVSGRALTLVLL